MLEIDMIRDDWESVKAEITEQEEVIYIHTIY